jgi:ATP-dependent DNA helicase RecG
VGPGHPAAVRRHAGPAGAGTRDRRRAYRPRRIGLSDQACTGIRAIFRNWNQLGRVPPTLRNDKARKEFELVLVKQPLVTDAMRRFRESIGVSLNPEQAAVLALALGRADEPRISLTDIRGLGVNTAQQAKQLADFLVRQQLLESVGETSHQVRDAVRQRFVQSTEQVTPQVTPHVAPQAPPKLSGCCARCRERES